MPTLVSHSFVAFTIGKILEKSSSFAGGKGPYNFWLFSIICAIMPDIDAILMSFGVPYSHMFGHRGISHSIFFVLLISFIVVSIGFRKVSRNSKQWWLLLVYFLFIGLSHILLDALTSGGLGIGLFMPFDSTRYFFSYRPIRVSPFSLLYFFNSEGQKIIVSEFVWIWIPSITLLFLAKIARNRRKPEP